VIEWPLQWALKMFGRKLTPGCESQGQVSVLPGPTAHLSVSRRLCISSDSKSIESGL
jgi:hypothetical protein